RRVLVGPAPPGRALGTLFGLPAPPAPAPLRVPPTPLLVTWRLAALAALWAEQDQHPNPPRAYAVVADPDVIGAADVVAGSNGQPIRTLLAQRAKQLSDFTLQLDALRTGADAPHALASMQAL